VGVSLLFKEGLLEEVKLFQASLPPLTPFLPYYLKAGEPLLSWEEVNKEKLPEECLPLYEFLRREVSFGKTITYGELGKLFNLHPRKVALCMKRNPFPLFVPCHRVVSSSGLGGYSPGLKLKRLLLLHEGAYKLGR